MQETENEKGNRFCKACGTPAEAKLCSHCGTVLDFPDEGGLIEDQGAAVRRDFEGRTEDTGRGAQGPPGP
ncbi:zinc ribbon domain-containing protein [Streptomyces sp. FXY-T5]|uniref:double zinc ribbon domain-containing protein n=1 Tax=Streptomyces sp. FXY-T5 TaxID=3064901 RepID=UPI00359C8153